MEKSRRSEGKGSIENLPEKSRPWLFQRIRCGILSVLGALLCAGSALAGASPGYTLHFNFIKSDQGARETVAMAESASAGVVSLAPPAHIWEDPLGMRILDAAIDETKQTGLRIIFSRLDADQSGGQAWLYAHALKQHGRLPNGALTTEWFRATVGNHPFEQWQHDETLYYARRYGNLPNLAGAAVGGMVEPFVSQRGSLLQWSEATGSYEIAQYTPQGLKEWHRWLRNRFKTVSGLNQAYKTFFASVSKVPMPRNGSDRRFGTSRAAYFDLVQCLNDWLVKQYQDNRRLWHQYSSAPFLLQLSGFSTEKIARGRPEFAAFDLPSWVDMADGVGMSLYTNADYDDWGHSSNVATLQLLASAGEAGKPTVIMESGCEAPHVTLDPHELSFATWVGLLINPDYYVYEYFRYSRDGRVDPGMMVTPEGKIHEPGYSTVSQMLNGAGSFGRTMSMPCIIYLSAPLTARRSQLAGQVNRAIYQLAGYVPCRMLPWQRFANAPAGSVILVPPGFHRVTSANQLRSFLDCAREKKWCLVSDKSTCAELARLRILVSLYPLPFEKLLSKDQAHDEAFALHRELRTIAEFRQILARQPIEPRPGLVWLHHGSRLYVWIDDALPITGHEEALREEGIDQLWCSTRSGEPAEIVLASESREETRSSIPARQWQELSVTHGD